MLRTQFKHLLNRYHLFRREYHAMSSHWLVRNGLWLWHIPFSIIAYVYHAEILQLRYSKEIVKQKNDNIRQEEDKEKPQDLPKVFDPLLSYTKFLFFPFVIVFFIGRKIWRFWVLKSYPLCIKKTYSGAKKNLTSKYIGFSCSFDLTTTENKAYPAGLILLRYSLQTEGKPLAVSLHIDPGTGFSDEYSIPLQITSGIDNEKLIELPLVCHSLRLLMHGCQQEIKLDGVSLEETNIVRAAWRQHIIFKESFFTSLFAIFTRQLPGIRNPMAYKGSYAGWIRKFDVLTKADKKAIHQHIESFQDNPIIGLLLCINNDDPTGLKLTLKSLKRQLYPHWQLFIVKQGELSPKTIAELDQLENAKQPLQIIEYEPDLSCLRPALRETSQGDFIAILNQGDVLSEHALYMVTAAVQGDWHHKMIYSDHDYLGHTGHRYDPCFKPDWDYELYLSSTYINGFVVYDGALTKEIVGSIDQVDVLDMDNFQLEFIEKIEARQISHLPFILIHQYVAESREPVLMDTRADAVIAHLQRTHQSASVVPNPYNESILRIRQSNPSPEPLVSIIILTRNGYLVLSQCIDGLLRKTDYENMEIILIDNGSDDDTTLNYLDSLRSEARITIISRPGAFNFSALNNFAVSQAKGEHVLLMNNDVSVIDAGWLKEMVSHIVRPEVGIVGAKLLYENESIQHGGMIIGLGGVAGHSFRHYPRYSPGAMQRLHYSQSLSCVTAACLLTRKELYKDVGGLDEENLKITFNDVDYCLKVQDRGYRIIWTPFAELFHLESISRGSDLAPENLKRWMEEYDFMQNKWQETLQYDPFYNPNLTIIEEDFSLTNKPRTIKAWSNYYQS